MKRQMRNTDKTRPVIPNLVLVFSLVLLTSLSFPGDFPSSRQEGQLSVTDYKIGPKDLLEIKVFELPELNQTVRVSEDGSISLVMLGKVEVSGLTAQELEQKLGEILVQKYTHVAHVSVFIREYQKVSVLGAVGRPGMYELVGPMTLLQVISQAGGLTNQIMNELYIYRQEKDGRKTKITINLEDLMVRGNQAANVDLQPSDVINIPIEQMLTVYVYGEVKNPGAIPFKQSKGITLLQAIAQAGGTTDWASTARVMVKKKEKGTGKEMQRVINLKTLISGKTADIVLEEGDVVIVP